MSVAATTRMLRTITRGPYSSQNRLIRWRTYSAMSSACSLLCLSSYLAAFSGVISAASRSHAASRDARSSLWCSHGTALSYVLARSARPSRHPARDDVRGPTLSRSGHGPGYAASGRQNAATRVSGKKRRSTRAGTVFGVLGGFRRWCPAWMTSGTAPANVMCGRHEL